MCKLIANLFVSFCILASSALFARGQATPAAEGTASISGKVTLNGQPLASARVLLTSTDREDGSLGASLLEGGARIRKSLSDASGQYSFSGLTPGSYHITVFAPALVEDKAESEITLSEGQTREAVDFSLLSGGVITGKVMMDNGFPAVHKSIIVEPALDKLDPSERGRIRAMIGHSYTVATDDRGIYRLYGMADGEYFISVPTGGGRRQASATYYPGVADKAAAVHVKAKAGTETTGIDFKLPGTKKGYDVRGRVLDETGEGVPGVMVQCSAVPGAESDEHIVFNYFSGQANSNAKGEFKISGVPTGKFKASIVTFFDNEANVYSDPANFQVKDQDLLGVEIKAHRGLTASGIASIEGNDDPAIVAQLSQVDLVAAVTDQVGAGEGFTLTKASVAPDGSFTLTGLQPGKLEIALNPFSSQSKFSLLRVERANGAQSGTIDINVGDPVTDIRVVLGYGNCTIYGRATLQGGSLGKGSVAHVAIRRQGNDAENRPGLDRGPGRSGTSRFLQISPDGTFRAEGLVPGDYEVTLTVNLLSRGDGEAPGAKEVSQSVTLISGAQLEVNLTLDLSSGK